MSLTRGFANTAQAAGARLYEKTPATELEKKGRKWVIRTPNGKVTCDTVILTTNAYTDSLWPKLRQTLLPLHSIALVTAPLSKTQQDTVLPGRRTIADTRLAIYFSRFDADNRLIFGCVGSSETVGTLGGKGRLRTGLHHVFPQFKGVRPVNPTCKTLLRRLGRVTPWHEFFETVDLVVGDPSENPCEPGLRINAVQLGCFNQGVNAMAMAFPPPSEPANIQFLRPIATGFMARSAVLLSGVLTSTHRFLPRFFQMSC